MLMSDRAESFLIFLTQGLWPNTNIDKAQDDYACEGNPLSDPGGRKEGGAPASPGLPSPRHVLWLCHVTLPKPLGACWYSYLARGKLRLRREVHWQG